MAFRSPIARQRRTVRSTLEEGWLDQELAVATSSKEVKRLDESLQSEMDRAGEQMTQNTGQRRAVEFAPIHERHAVATKTATILQHHASKLADLETQYRAASTRLTSNLVALFHTAPPERDFSGTLETLRVMEGRAYRNKANVIAYREVHQEGRQVNMSSAVNSACDDLISVLDRLVEDEDLIGRSCRQAQEVITQRRTVTGSQYSSDLN